MTSRSVVLGTAIALTVAAPAAAQAPFSAPTAVGGFGAQVQLAGTSSLAVTAEGRSVLAGSGDTANVRFPVAAFGSPGDVPRVGRSLSAPGVITSQPVVAAEGRVAAVVWGAGHTAYLRVATDGRWGQPIAVGRSRLKPQPAVAIQPATGRITVLWRGSSRRGNRLQWRITTGGKLGRTHTLGEFGNDPRIGTDRSGKTIAVWTPYSVTTRGVRTAARRVGEFTKPMSITTAQAQDVRLDVGADGEAIAAWRTPSEGGADVQAPRGTPTWSTRTANTAFSRPQQVAGVADASTLSLDRGATGAAVLAFDRQTDDLTATVSAVFRPAPGRPFGAVQALGTPGFVAAPGASAAVDDRGVATVAWGASVLSGQTGEPGLYAARSTPAGAFGAPQRIDAAAVRAPVLAAAGGSTTLLAWVGEGGVRVARAAP
ncbi:hypothetical protein [Conexibacter sp. SYSU D00693]|uniref:hypothetical protein n=1 Tax=Conexibacter sp. SYSU D00693 TaxID=2812560 RepID=UPI00196B872E|nr:hypothetical protein [Conexibacter sp. SYSU D00693]